MSSPVTSLKRSNSSSPTKMSSYSPSKTSQTPSNKMKFWGIFSSKKYIKVRTSDGKMFEVEKKVMAAESLTIRRHAAKFFSPRTINLRKIDSRTFSRVMKYCVDKHAELVNKFDERMFFELIEAAAELEIHSLINTLCQLAPDVLRKSTYDDQKDLLDLMKNKAKATAHS